MEESNESENLKKIDIDDDDQQEIVTDRGNIVQLIFLSWGTGTLISY